MVEVSVRWQGPLRWALLAVLAGALCSSAAAEQTVLSLLAVGDTGEPATALPWLDSATSVASAMAAEDGRASVDGLVLLGDNFYPDGLKQREFKDRLRSDLVGRFCHFIAFTARGRKSLGDSCEDAEEERHPVPIYAVLGNHDYHERESPRLQREHIGDYLADWQMPRRYAALHELPGGVSLVLVDSMLAVKGDRRRALHAILQRARGPWRILATHYPLADAGDGHSRRWGRELSTLLEEAGVRIHLHLAGHVHNLQLLTMEAPRPALQVLAGSGSSVRAVEETGEDRIFAEAALGFVRVDLVREAEAERLRISVYPVNPISLDGFNPGRPAVRVYLSADGSVSTEAGATTSRAQSRTP
jgi:hypothetical protein